MLQMDDNSTSSKAAEQGVDFRSQLDFRTKLGLTVLLSIFGLLGCCWCLLRAPAKHAQFQQRHRSTDDSRGASETTGYQDHSSSPVKDSDDQAEEEEETDVGEWTMDKFVGSASVILHQKKG